jgi:hypothetical protein
MMMCSNYVTLFKNKLLLSNEHMKRNNTDYQRGGIGILGSGGGSIRYILSFLKNDAIKCTESI